jgi:hypothetical protein
MDSQNTAGWLGAIVAVVVLSIAFYYTPNSAVKTDAKKDEVPQGPFDAPPVVTSALPAKLPVVRDVIPRIPKRSYVVKAALRENQTGPASIFKLGQPR